MKKFIGFSLYILALIPLILYIYVSNSATYNLNEIQRLGIIGIICLLIYFGGFLLSKAYNSNKPMKINLILFFIMYLILVITLTLFDASWGRSGIKIRSINNVSKYINLKPFKTIKSYILVFDSLYPTKEIMLNLFGNLGAFMPMAIFLPLIFKRQNKFYIFLFTMILFVSCIEGLQLVTGSGRCDIDDVILNVGGAFFLYLILKIPPMKKLIRNILLLEGNKVSKIFIGFVIVCIIGIISYLVWLTDKREKLYRNNLNKLYAKYSFNVEIVDKSRYCEDTEEMFYEDDLYKYYFECRKSNNIYILINNSEEYKLSEALSDDFKYDVSIELLGNLGLKYKRVNKYTYINMSTKSLEKEKDIYIKPTIYYEKDDDILSVMTSDYSISSEYYKYKLHLIPKSSGETILYIIAKDDEIELERIKYKIIIDDNLNISYQLIETE